jgi:formate-dependent nitrite reductase membrane component NrfD
LFLRPAFYLYAGLKISSGLLMLTMNLEFKPPASNIVSDVMSVMRNVEMVVLFIAVFVLGQWIGLNSTASSLPTANNTHCFSITQIIQLISGEKSLFLREPKETYGRKYLSL